MKYAKLDENGVVIQVQPYTEKGFIKVDDTVHCGMVQTADGFVVPPLSTEQLKEQATLIWKQQRQMQVDNIVVTYNDIEYQGDETSQTRISRTIVGLNALNVQTGTDNRVPWTALDNSEHLLNVTDLSTILLFAGQEQSRLWNEGRP